MQILKLLGLKEAEAGPGIQELKKTGLIIWENDMEKTWRHDVDIYRYLQTLTLWVIWSRGISAFGKS